MTDTYKQASQTVRKLVRALKKQGWVCTRVNDGEQWHTVSTETEIIEIALCTDDQSVIRFQKVDTNNNPICNVNGKFAYMGFVTMIGSNGDECIHDWYTKVNDMPEKDLSDFGNTILMLEI